jgi:hypothetical protein
MTRPIEVSYKGKKFRIEELGTRIAEIPRLLRRPALLTISQFMLRKFKLYPRYKEVSRKRAYPEVEGFFSDKQRRFVMAGIAAGRIQPGRPHRTQNLKNAWRIEDDNSTIRSIKLINDDPAAVFAYDPVYQARQLDLVGWKDVDEMTEENLPDALLELEVWIANNLDKPIDAALSGSKGK